MTALQNSTVQGMTQEATVGEAPRAPGDWARDTYRELRQGGLSDTDIMAFAGELLSLVATDVRAESAAE